MGSRGGARDPDGEAKSGRPAEGMGREKGGTGHEGGDLVRDRPWGRLPGGMESRWKG